jgi:hypothetical protein
MKKIVSVIVLFFFLIPLLPAQNVGINQPNPVHARLEVSGSVGASVAMFGADRFGVTISADHPEIGFNHFYNSGSKTIKAGYAAYMGMFADNGEIYIGNFNGNQSAADFGPIAGGREAIRIKQNGNVGIGTSNPSFPLTVRSLPGGQGIIQQSPDGLVQAGFWTATNGAYVQTWSNTELNFTAGNGVSRMVLRTTGNLEINKTVSIGQKLTSPATGGSNLLPVAYAKVDAAGTVLAGTSNVSVVYGGTGFYRIYLSDEPTLSADKDKFTVFVTAENSNSAWMPAAQINNNDYILVTTTIPHIQYSNSSGPCDCGIFSLITSGGAIQYFDSGFIVMIYKND